MALSVKSLTLDFSSSHGLMVHGIEPRVGLCADSVEPVWDWNFLFLFLSASPLLALSLSLSKYILK